MLNSFDEESVVEALSNSILGLREKLEEERFCMLAVDCHPWDGILEISLLTEVEKDKDLLLYDVDEMAAWKYFQVSRESSERVGLDAISKSIKTLYSGSMDKVGSVDFIFDTIAKAVGSDNFEATLRSVLGSDGIKISVANPDNGKEYFSPRG